MSIRLSELPDYLEKYVKVEYDDPRVKDGDSNKTITGKLIAVSKFAVAVQARGKSELIKLEHLLQVEEVLRFTVREGLIIRRIAKVSLESVRQHLLDRHGLDPEYVRGITDEDALMVHGDPSVMNHKHLGHTHGPTEKGRPGRKPKKKAEDGTDPIPVQRSHEPDGDTTDVCDS